MRVLQGALVAVGMMVAGTAHAAVLQVTQSGHVASGYDDIGIFGSPGGSLTGKAFSVVAYFDTTLGGFSIGSFSTALVGGSDTIPPDSPGSATLTIDGVSITTDGNGLTGYIRYDTQTRYTFLSRNTFGGIETITTLNGFSGYGGAIYPRDIVAPYKGACNITALCGGQFLVENDLAGHGPFVAATQGTFESDAFEVRVLSVPEPQTWAMMILGFGLIGATARQARMSPKARRPI